MKAIETTIDLPLADTEVVVQTALEDQGFGVLTEIDVTATLRTSWALIEHHSRSWEPAIRTSHIAPRCSHPGRDAVPPWSMYSAMCHRLIVVNASQIREPRGGSGHLDERWQMNNGNRNLIRVRAESACEPGWATFDLGRGSLRLHQLQLSGEQLVEFGPCPATVESDLSG